VKRYHTWDPNESNYCINSRGNPLGPWGFISAAIHMNIAAAFLDGTLHALQLQSSAQDRSREPGKGRIYISAWTCRAARC